MNLPASFIKLGFQDPATLKRGRRLLIGTDGPSDSGKSEFALSAPGPGLAICLDRGIDGVLDNPKPPATRRDGWAFKVIAVPTATQAKQPEYLDYWRSFYDVYKSALDNPDCRSVLVDGDSDSWELQRLAEFGKLTQIPPMMYTSVNAARRAMYNRAWDSKKIVIATNKIKKEYETIRNDDGTPNLKDGKEQREWTGDWERQGFPDQDYLFHIQLRHLYRPGKDIVVGPKTIKRPGEFGIRIMKCKASSDLIGVELWGDDCNFAGLVQVVYPQVPLEEWGF